MDISAGLIAKTLGALAAASAIGGGTWWMLEGEDEVKSNKITKYDKALMDYLHDGGKVQFAVSSGSTQLNDFPTFTSTTSAQKITVTVKIKVNGDNNNANTDGKLVDNPNATAESRGKKEKLTNINGSSSGWTWICEMDFTRNSNSSGVDNLNDTQKDKVFKASDDGLFGKLKKDITTSGYTEEKRLKKEFIRKCGHERGVDKNKEINEGSSVTEVKTADGKINFELIKGETNGAWGKDTNKLFFKDKRNFNRWFSDGQTQKPTQATGG